MTTKPFFSVQKLPLLFFPWFFRERDYSIVSISMSQYPITSLEWGSCRELVLLLFLARFLRNNRCICMAKFKWTNEALILHWTMKTWCTLNGKKTFITIWFRNFWSTCWPFQMVYEGDFWCLCTVTFWQKVDLQIINKH